MKKQPKKAKPVEAWATASMIDGQPLAVSLWRPSDGNVVRLVPATSEAEVRRLKRIERAAKKVVRLCPGTELLDGLSRSLANSHELNLHREVSRSLRTKRTKP